MFKATVAELPDVAIFEKTYEAAYAQAIEVIESLYELSIEDGGNFPEARSQAESLGYSGRLTLRMPRWLHAQLGGQADAENISLNQYLISMLSAAGSINALVGEASGMIASKSLAQGSIAYQEWYKSEKAHALYRIAGTTIEEINPLRFAFPNPSDEVISGVESGSAAPITFSTYKTKQFGNC